MKLYSPVRMTIPIGYNCFLGSQKFSRQLKWGTYHSVSNKKQEKYNQSSKNSRQVNKERHLIIASNTDVNQRYGDWLNKDHVERHSFIIQIYCYTIQNRLLDKNFANFDQFSIPHVVHPRSRVNSVSIFRKFFHKFARILQRPGDQIAVDHD